MDRLAVRCSVFIIISHFAYKRKSFYNLFLIFCRFPVAAIPPSVPERRIAPIFPVAAAQEMVSCGKQKDTANITARNKTAELKPASNPILPNMRALINPPKKLPAMAVSNVKIPSTL